MTTPYDPRRIHQPGDPRPDLCPPGTGALRGGPLDVVPPIGQFQSTTIRALIVGIASLLATFGIKWLASDQQIEQIVQGVGSLVTLGSMVWAWYGRVKATRVVATKAVDQAARTLAVAMLGAGVVLTGSGCGALAPQQSVATILNASERTYTPIANELATMIEQGAISDPAQIRKIKDIDQQVNDAFDEAETKLDAGDRVGAGFVASKLAALIDQLFPLKRSAKSARKPATQRPSTRPVLHTEAPWASPNWSLRVLRHSPNSSQHLRPSRLASNSPPSKTPWCDASAKPHTLVCRQPRTTPLLVGTDT